MKISLPVALFILFLALKLTHQIAWSWWWVTAPLWAGFAAAVGFMVGALAIAGAVGVAAAVRDRWGSK